MGGYTKFTYDNACKGDREYQSLETSSDTHNIDNMCIRLEKGNWSIGGCYGIFDIGWQRF
jgi:hypothetical protein